MSYDGTNCKDLKPTTPQIAPTQIRVAFEKRYLATLDNFVPLTIE